MERGVQAFQGEICKALGLSKGAVSLAIGGLKARGLVEVERRGLRSLLRL